MLRILVVEDEAHNRQALSDLLKRMGHEAILAMDGHDALEITLAESIDLVLCDVRMPRMDGLEFFDALISLQQPGIPSPPFVFMTAYGRLEEAVSAMRKGALNFLSKPLRKRDIAAAIDEASRVLDSRKGLCALRNVAASSDTATQEGRDFNPYQAVYASRAFGDVLQMVDRVASTHASVLFVGESGTGKEVLARRLHERSNRATGRFIAFHSGAMPETLLESELFGHEKGAFTGAEVAREGQIRAADGGTFFIDEVSSMPLGVQAKLLRVIQDRTVTPLGATRPISCDLRWVAATNVRLEELVARGSFREDLLYRLRVIVIEVPPLRDRVEDIDVLVDRFVDEFARREGRDPLILRGETRALLRNYSWPGNVRELRNVVERASALAAGIDFTPDLLPEHISQVAKAREIRIAVGSSLESVEDRLIEETLSICQGDKTKAAQVLGVAPRTIYRWIERKTSGRPRVGDV